MPTNRTLSRRAALGALAALVPATQAAAVPSVSGADPILDLVQQHREVCDAGYQLTAALDEAEHEAAKKFGDPPNKLLHWRHIHVGGSSLVFDGGKSIDRRRDELLAEGKVDPQTIEREYKMKKKRNQEMVAEAAGWYRRAGLAELVVDNGMISTAEIRTRKRLSITKPTTLAGAAAAVTHIIDSLDEDTDYDDWHRDVLANVVEALRRMTVTAQA